MLALTGGSCCGSTIPAPVSTRRCHSGEPSTTGSVVDEVRGVTHEKMAAAIRDQFAARYTIVEGALSDDVLRLAERVLPEHEPG